MSAALLLAGLLMVTPAWEPGPDDPVCEPGQVTWVDHCAQGQLPDEVIGRQIDVDPAAGEPVELAHTGSRVLPLLMLAFGLVVVGGLLVLVERDARRGEDDVLDEVLAEALRTRKAMTE